MTDEEVIELANGGDASAMNALGHYYLDQKDYREAYEWYAKAADTGDNLGCHQAALLGATLGHVHMKTGMDDGMEYMVKALQYGREFLAGCATGAVDQESIDRFKNDTMLDIVAHIGQVLYAQDRFEEALALIDSTEGANEDSSLAILRGWCLSDKAEKISEDAHKTRNAQELNMSINMQNEAINLLGVAESSDMPRLFPGRQAKTLSLLAVIYRTKFGNCEYAYNCIQRAMGIPEVPDALKQMLYEESQKYHKGFFGGWSYRG